MEWDRGPLHFRSMGVMQKGQKVTGHSHNYEHVMLVVRGAMNVRARLPDGRIVDYDYGDDTGNGRDVLIAAGIAHELTALKDGTEYLCVFVPRDSAGAIVTRHEGIDAAYR